MMTENPKKIIHFTLGPVQGFIEDARRTRDFWAGSFLLSWLSGQAMAALKDAGGTIIFPQVYNDGLFKAITKKDDKPYDGTPYIGSLPNRFKAEVPDGIDNAGELCKKVIEDSWNKLAGAVWDKFIKDVASEKDLLTSGKDQGTEDIWKRQVDNFWDIAWVIGDETDDDGKWLDQRKNWRTHIEPDEGGDLCRLMGRYQEISGYPRINTETKQTDFWDALSEVKYFHQSSGENRRLLELNIGKDERLCAIALIKRLFPLIAKDVIGWDPGGDDLNIINWPSVSYIAAVPWLKAVSDKQSVAYADIVKDNVKSGFKGETETQLFGLLNNGIFDLDGHLLHQDGIATWKDFKGEKENEKELLLKDLNKIQKEIGGAASEFYAILIMDGDQIGSKLGSHESIVKNGLAAFTQSVKEYFDPNPENKNPANGVLIYAGGDDVLALVPVDIAIEAALYIREKYKDAFDKVIKENKDTCTVEEFTMSAALVFAQYKIPLRSVLKKAHHYIDNIAKDKNGRDSLAIAVMKPGGIAFDWVSCWEGDKVSPVKTMDEMSKDPKQYSTSFFYNIKERYAPLFHGDDPDNDGKNVSDFSKDENLIKALLKAEYKKQFSKKELENIKVGTAIGKLMHIGKPLIRKWDENKGQFICNISEGCNFDGVLIARFLSVEGRWHLEKNQGGQSE